MQLNHYENVKNKSTDLRKKVQMAVEQLNPRPKVIAIKEENGLKIKVIEPR
jgi:hypothetical protein